MAKKTISPKPARANGADTGATVQVVLDRSGSMESIRDATIRGFNILLDEQRKLPGARFGLTQFDHDGGKPCIDVLSADAPIAEVAPLSRDSYKPRGGTPLYDAIGRTIAALEARKPAGKVIFAIITDGQENQSAEWTHQMVFDKIAEKKKAGWEFSFVGANVDAYAVGGAMGINLAAIRQYDSTPDSTMAAYGSLSRAATAYRTGAVASMMVEPENAPAGWVAPTGSAPKTAAPKAAAPKGLVAKRRGTR
jgi:hypothetical protein